MSDKQTWRAIDALYDAALAERSWDDAMEELRLLFGSVAVNLEIIDKRLMRPIFMCDAGLPPESIDRYMEQFSESSPRVLHGAGWAPGHIGYDSQILTEPEMDSNPFYQELLTPDDMRYFMSATLSNGRDEYGVFAVQRSPSQGHVNDDDIRLLKRIEPHVVRAVSIARRLGPISSASAQGVLLDESASAIFFLDANGVVVSQNQTADRLLDAHPKLIKKAQSRLSFETLVHRHFEAALTKALTPPARGSAFAMAAELPVPLGIFVTPLEKNQSAKVMPLSARVAVLISFQPSRLDLLRQLLSQSFDLTDRQCDLSIALLQGQSIDHFAQDHAISVATARSHLARVREKTNTHTQAELVSKLHQLVPSIL